MLVIGFGVLLCGMALVMETARQHYANLLDLALAMATYTAGALLAGFLLAFLRLCIDGRGFLWSAPLSLLFVLACAWRQPWAWHACIWGGAVLCATWLWWNRRAGIARTIVLLAGLGVLLLVQRELAFERDGKVVSLAWPWYAPIGCTVAFAFGWALSGRQRAG
jgi:hypothetical protein